MQNFCTAILTQLAEQTKYKLYQPRRKDDKEFVNYVRKGLYTIHVDSHRESGIRINVYFTYKPYRVELSTSEGGDGGGQKSQHGLCMTPN